MGSQEADAILIARQNRAQAVIIMGLLMEQRSAIILIVMDRPVRLKDMLEAEPLDAATANSIIANALPADLSVGMESLKQGRHVIREIHLLEGPMESQGAVVHLTVRLSRFPLLATELGTRQQILLQG